MSTPGALSFGRTRLPDEQGRALRRAIRLEWVTLGYMATCIVVVFFAMGSSQAMKAAWVEDMLALIPPVAFLFAQRRARRPVDAEHPYGHHRAVGGGHLAAAVALLGMGVYLIVDSAMGLLHGEHPPVGTVDLFGHAVWAGWVMIAAMAYTAIGPVVLGRMKLPLADTLHDRVLYNDADMQKADWRTATGTIVGVLGIGVGLWWADAVVAIAISVSIIRDGWTNVRHASGALMDAQARTVDGTRRHPLIEQVDEALEEIGWVHSSRSRVRDMGHVFHVESFVVPHAGHTADIDDLEHAAQVARDLDWKVDDVVIVPVRQIPETFTR
ncbi:cation diffusion facilitator family transporter [Janibacter hoylei]|uniref:cation diffusion facilitator family transporter n=1 Tax=Janibacter hoylei TaxID=364298 RepID=UPI0024916EBD|nr:cation transporter [Janibacter hoylei]